MFITIIISIFITVFIFNTNIIIIVTVIFYLGRQLGLGQKKGDPTAQKRGRSKNNYKASAKNSNDLSTGKDSKDTKKPRNKQTSATRSIAVTPARPRSLRMSLNTTCDNVKGSIEGGSKFNGILSPLSCSFLCNV